MRIENTSVQTSGSHQLESISEETENLEFYTTGSGGDAEEPAFVLEISSGSAAAVESEPDFGANDTESQVKLKLIEDFFRQLTGRTVRLRKTKGGYKTHKSAGVSVQVKMKSPARRDNWGLVYEYKQAVREKEQVNYKAAGAVTTSDGRVIAFNLNFIMARTYEFQHNTSVRAGAAAKVDPLVIALSGAPKLSRAKQAFDINLDGAAENISFATGGSGFLALDKNGDGVINDGSELFGPSSGDGFAELRAYDMDGNGWIDEGDDIFGSLSVLSLSDDGQRTLFKLGDAGVGAIYLHESGTDFTFKDAAGDYGQMDSTSVYLREDGSAGTVHHIDVNI